MFWLKSMKPRYLSPLSFSYQTPELEGRSNLTSLDIQIKKLRDKALTTINDGARRMREEATEIRDTLTDIESWANKLKVLAEEVQTRQGKALALMYFPFFLDYYLEVKGEPSLNLHGSGAAVQKSSLAHRLFTLSQANQTHDYNVWGTFKNKAGP